MIRVGIIGAGIGAQHLDGYAALPDRYAVNTLCDLDRARAEPLAERYPSLGVTDQLDTVLADPAIDVIDICLPSHLHARVTLQALEAGKAVICEKPIAASLHEADAIAEASARSGRPVFPVFQYRYGLGTAQLRALMEAGLTGAAYAASLETHWNRGADYYCNDWRGTWQGEMGGVLVTHAIHIHDMLPAILGPVSRVYAELTTRVNPVEVEDCAAITLRMSSGAVATSSVTLGAAQESSRLKILFEGLTVTSDTQAYAPATKAWHFTARDPAQQSRIDEVLARVEAPRVGYAGLFEAIANALDGAPGQEVTLEDGRRSLEFATACYAASRQGLPVTLPLAPDHALYDGWLP